MEQMREPLYRVTDMSRIAPLFDGWPENLARSTLDGCMGEAYADPENTAALVVNGDIAFLVGDAGCPEAEALAAHRPPSLQGRMIRLSSREAEWHPVIERVWSGQARKVERYAIRKDMDHFDQNALRRFTETLPPGVRLAPLEGELYHMVRAEEWSRDFVSQFRDDADYRSRGLGVVALHGDEPVAGASSYVVFRGGIEIEIDTRKDWRRRGLATACGAALMLRCFERGLYPSWDAANRESVALAEKLGYVYDRPYTTYEID